VNPRYPVYIVSKGRWQSRLTMKALDRMRVNYSVIIEAQEFDNYGAFIPHDRLLILPQKYLDQYDTCDDPSLPYGKGSGAARNFAWDHSSSLGAKRHWLLDDNIEAFNRLNRNIKPECYTGAIFRAAEDFVDRYTNIAIAGFNYYSFCKTTDAVPAFNLNTRVYSCLLLQNDIPYRWRGRYNEDTDLSLRVLKDGWVTCLFNAFLAGKVTTLRMKGGNTDTIYTDGTLRKSQMIADLHPDVAKVVWRFNRWHHHVDYRPFKGNKLERKADAPVVSGVNEYGMRLGPRPKRVLRKVLKPTVCLCPKCSRKGKAQLRLF